MLVHEEHRVCVVLEALRHLPAVLCEHEAVHNQVLEGRAIEERRREDEQRVKPASGLINALCNEVGREVALKNLTEGELIENLKRGIRHATNLFVLEGVVELRVGHRAALEPTIKDLGDAAKRRIAGNATRKSDVVDLVAVKIGDTSDATQAFELGNATDHHDLAVILAHPQRERRAPVAIT